MIRPLLRFAVSFVLGVFLSQTVLPEVWWLWTAVAVLFPGIAVVVLRRGKWYAPIAVLSTGLMLGSLWVAVYSRIYLAPVEPLIGTERTMTVELLDYPEKQAYQVRCTAQVDGIRGKMMLYGDDSLLLLSPGDKLTGTVKCYSAVQVGGKTVAT